MTIDARPLRARASQILSSWVHMIAYARGQPVPRGSEADRALILNGNLARLAEAVRR